MLLLGVTQRSEMKRHLSVFVSENFPDVSELDASFYPSDGALSSLMYRAMILHRQTHIDQERVLRLVRFIWQYIQVSVWGYQSIFESIAFGIDVQLTDINRVEVNFRLMSGK